MPGFSLYETLASSKGIECKFYRLDPGKQWEVDLDHLESLIDENTACILINNPSNPCGSVYTESHLLAFIALAKKHGLPIISEYALVYVARFMRIWHSLDLSSIPWPH